MAIKRLLLAPFIAFACLQVFDAPATEPGEGARPYFEAAIKARLWNHPEWINLIHYDDDHVSAVDDEHFFLAENGKTNPEAEMSATIEAFFTPGPTGDEHPLCRFPARRAWLGTQLAIGKHELPAVECREYAEWRKLVRAKQATMVFPTYYLNSPSSMFGHTLLRLDPDTGDEWSEWLSIAVNYGADTRATQADNSFAYAYKGLFGGYTGQFIVEPYYNKIREYNRIENRDIWEYRLNLDETETERMITHLWELRDIRFDYYFFDENCSYRLLELLEVARPGTELTDPFVLTAIPVDTIRAIEEAGLIDQYHYRPSQASKLRARINSIPEEQHDMIAALALDLGTADTESFTALKPEEQRSIVEAAYHYLRYTQTGKERDPAVARHSYALLTLINSYPALSDAIAPDTPPRPEQGHGSKRFTLGLGKRNRSAFGELGFRMGYHDVEDNEYGFLRGAQINIAAVQLRTTEDDSLQLYKLDFVDIFSVPDRSRFISPLSWNVYSGFERQLTHGVDQLVLHVTGGAGATYRLLENSSVYLMGRLRLESNKQLERAIEPAIGFSAGLMQHFGWSTAHLNLTGDDFSGSLYRLRGTYTHNFVIETDHSLNLSASYEWQDAYEFAEYRVNYQYYFW